MPFCTRCRRAARLLAAVGLAVAQACAPVLAQAPRPATPAPPAAAPAPPAPPAPAQPGQATPPSTPGQPQRTEIITYDNWSVTCTEGGAQNARRSCTAALRVAQQQTGQVVFAFLIGHDAQNRLVLVLQSPTGVSITPGIGLKLGTANPRRVPYVACDQNRCEASAPLEDAIVREAAAAANAEATVTASDGRALKFEFPMAGFDRALAAVRR